MKLELLEIFHKYFLNGKQYYYLIGAEYGQRADNGEDFKIVTGKFTGTIVKDFRFYNEEVGVCCEGVVFEDKLITNKNFSLYEQLEVHQEAIKVNGGVVLSLETIDGKNGLVKVVGKPIINKIKEMDRDYFPKCLFEPEMPVLKPINFYYDKIRESVFSQDAQIKRLIGSVYAWQEKIHSNVPLETLYQTKDNIFMVGGSGTGKSQMIRLLLNSLNIPYIFDSATRFTAEGYIGDSVDDLLLNLIKVCNGDVLKAQTGIIVLDEIDKLNTKVNTEGVGTGAVQNALLNIMEGKTFTIGKGRGIQQETYRIDTTKIHYILVGSFASQMIAEKSMGFGSGAITYKSYVDLKASDIVEMGILPELIGRCPTIIGLNNLTIDDYVKIINDSKSSSLNFLREDYERRGIKFKVSEGFIQEVARMAFESTQGAREINTIIKSVIDTATYDTYAGIVKEINLDESLLYGQGQAMVKTAGRY